jgi:hypothetical protein
MQMEKQNNSELKRLKREFQARQQRGFDQLAKAKEKKPEFDKLDYPGKLKFMYDHFDGISGISDNSGMILSVYPDEADPEQIRLFNEWRIAKWQTLWDTLGGELFDKYSFDRLEARFYEHIEKIKNTNKVPIGLITEFIEGEIKTYSDRLNSPALKKEVQYYKGNWDLSKKVIQTEFLIAQAFSNYVPFLKDQLTKGVTRGREEKTFPEYLQFDTSEEQIWFADQLKNVFKGVYGIKTRRMIEALITLNLIKVSSGDWASLIDQIEKYFDWDIGTYQSIQNPTRPKNIDNEIGIIKKIISRINKN